MILNPHRAHAHKQMPCRPPSNDLKTRCFYAHLPKYHQHEQTEPYRAPLSIPPRQPDNVPHCKNHDWCSSPKPESSTEGLRVIVTWCECLIIMIASSSPYDAKAEQLCANMQKRKHWQGSTRHNKSCLSSYITIWPLGWQMF